MNMYKRIAKHALIILAFGLAIAGCQKMERPPLKELILDPPPPAYTDLKSFWGFENNATDAGENKLNTTTSNVTYVAGVNGQAVRFGAGGYILAKAIGDTVTYPNGFKGIPADTLTNLGSFTVSFWMNVPGPVTGGAQGVFSISNKNEFWGNLDMFLENLDNGNEAFIKIHMFNAGVASGNGEEWSETKVANALGKWTHIAVTYDEVGSKLSLFVDGQTTGINNKVLGGGNYGKVKFNNFNGLVLGTYQFQTTPSLTNHGPESWARSLNGAMDQFRLYDRALTPGEITDLFTTKK